MAITLRADNRILFKDAKYSYLLDNVASAAATVYVANTEGITVGSFVVIGNIGSENTELKQVATATAATGAITFVGGATTSFAHSESSRVTVVPYNKVRFWWTPIPTVPVTSATTIIRQNQNSVTTTKITSTITSPTTTVYNKSIDPTYEERIDFTPPILWCKDTQALTNAIDIIPSMNFTEFADSAHATGYGWFAYYNSVSLTYSQLSSPIPYAGFEPNSVKYIFDMFDSSLNNKELKLISMSDRMAWMNEGLSQLVNELNLINWEFKSTSELILNIKSGQGEYLLPEDFSDLLYIYDEDGVKVDFFKATQEKPVTSAVMRYTIRGRYIVFEPSPEEDISLYMTYLQNSPIVKNLSDTIDLPNRSYFFLKDYMLYRAYEKLDNVSRSNNSLVIFKNEINQMKIYAAKRDNSLDQWGISSSSNV